MGIDPSPEFLGAAQRRVSDPRARFEVGDARALPVASDGYDAVVAGLVLNFVPDPAPAVAEMVRAARPGGAVGAYVWDYRGEMQRAQYFWAAVAATDADSRGPRSASALPHLPSPSRWRTCFARPDWATWRSMRSTCRWGFGTSTTSGCRTPWPAPAAAQRYVSGLDDDRKAALREQLRATLPIAADGSLHLIDRAWAVRGTKRAA